MKIRNLFYFIITLSFFSCSELTNNNYGLKDYSSYPIGNAISYGSIQTDSAYQILVLKNVNSITAENEFKMKSVFKAYDSLDFTKTDKIRGFCRNNNLRLHGHCFVWHSSIPFWMNEIRDSSKLENLLKHYIYAIGKRYKDDIKSWDVVNEAISDSMGLMRKSLFTEVLGENFVSRMFKYANEAVPNAKSFYNDYSIEYNSEKLDSAIALIDKIRSEGIPVHGIGFQMHTMLDTPDIQTFKRSLEKAVEKNLLVHISELDVSINRYNTDPIHYQINDSLLKLQKERYYDIIKTYNETVPENLKWGITFWGFTDKYNWIAPFYKRPDWPAVFDSSLNPKPAYEGVKNSLISGN